MEEGAADNLAELEPQLTADGSTTLFSSRYAQTFHSHHGAVSEAMHVFVEGSGVAARLRSGSAARILEVGFGTGLNFLLTAQSAVEGGAAVEYVALERAFLAAGVLSSLGYGRYAREPLIGLLRFRRELGDAPRPGVYRAGIAGAGLELRLGEAEAADIEAERFDAIYHDAFSPDANPELWSREFLARLAGSLIPGGVLVSYTVKGDVRRYLANAGLQVSKVAGPPGGKREMLRAVKPGQGIPGGVVQVDR
ncbi:MAG: tRNA (5-methylaminomethyl-2-thiouridine)(34)-methyltransferase MnmD [Trueperaceae bacterium]